MQHKRNFSALSSSAKNFFSVLQQLYHRQDISADKHTHTHRILFLGEKFKISESFSSPEDTILLLI
jgi:hypothetical protein